MGPMHRWRDEVNFRAAFLAALSHYSIERRAGRRPRIIYWPGAQYRPFIIFNLIPEWWNEDDQPLDRQPACRN